MTPEQQLHAAAALVVQLILLAAAVRGIRAAAALDRARHQQLREPRGE